MPNNYLPGTAASTENHEPFWSTLTVCWTWPIKIVEPNQKDGGSFRNDVNVYQRIIDFGWHVPQFRIASEDLSPRWPALYLWCQNHSSSSSWSEFFIKPPILKKSSPSFLVKSNVFVQHLPSGNNLTVRYWCEKLPIQHGGSFRPVILGYVYQAGYPSSPRGVTGLVFWNIFTGNSGNHQFSH